MQKKIISSSTLFRSIAQDSSSPDGTYLHSIDLSYQHLLEDATQKILSALMSQLTEKFNNPNELRELNIIINEKVSASIRTFEEQQSRPVTQSEKTAYFDYAFVMFKKQYSDDVLEKITANVGIYLDTQFHPEGLTTVFKRIYLDRLNDLAGKTLTTFMDSLKNFFHEIL